MKAAGTFHQASVYDSEILCEECEKKFSEFDRYGWEILGPMAVDRPPPGLNLGNDVYKIDCDTDKLRRFILSVLWRASVSKSSFLFRRKSGTLRNHDQNEVIRSSTVVERRVPNGSHDSGDRSTRKTRHRNVSTIQGSQSRWLDRPRTFSSWRVKIYGDDRPGQVSTEWASVRDDGGELLFTASVSETVYARGKLCSSDGSENVESHSQSRGR